MKTKVNIICIFIFIAIIAGIFKSINHHFGDFNLGYAEGRESIKEREEEEGRHFFTRYFSVRAKNPIAYTDSILNEKTGELTAMQYREIVVKVPQKKAPTLYFILVIPLSILLLVCFFTQLITFFKFIYAINKSVVFEWSNVRKLRIMGYATLGLFICGAVMGFLESYQFSWEVEFTNYNILAGKYFDFFQMLLGLSILLIAEVFAIGLRLREEQELTI